MKKVEQLKPETNKETILNNCKFDDIINHNVGEVYSYKNFMNLLNSKCISTHDGYGYLMLDNKIIENAELCLSSKSVILKHRFNISFKKLESLYKEHMKFVWFNY